MGAPGRKEYRPMLYKVGDRVREILHPDAWGTVVEIGDSSAESAKYEVNWDDGTAGLFDAVALKPVSPDEENARAAERAIADDASTFGDDRARP